VHGEEEQEEEDAPRLAQLGHVGVDEGDAGRALHPPDGRLLLLGAIGELLVLLPRLPPAVLELVPRLLRVGHFLEPAEREELGAEFAVASGSN